MAMVNLPPLVEGTSNLPLVVTPGNSLRDIPLNLDTLKLVSMYCQYLNLVGASLIETSTSGAAFHVRVCLLA